MKKILPVSRGECTKTYQQADARKAKNIWSKILKRLDHNRKPEWISNREKDSKKIPKILHDSLRATTKNS